jgi:hypothetical protein
VNEAAGGGEGDNRKEETNVTWCKCECEKEKKKRGKGRRCVMKDVSVLRVPRSDYANVTAITAGVFLRLVQKYRNHDKCFAENHTAKKKGSPSLKHPTSFSHLRG